MTMTPRPAPVAATASPLAGRDTPCRAARARPDRHARPPAELAASPLYWLIEALVGDDPRASTRRGAGDDPRETWDDPRRTWDDPQESWEDPRDQERPRTAGRRGERRQAIRALFR
jgi:hypothetical protein